ncbi:uncharacterized protein METZ01_LOCUS279864, partial [marine metagenome]
MQAKRHSANQPGHMGILWQHEPAKYPFAASLQPGKTVKIQLNCAA